MNIHFIKRVFSVSIYSVFVLIQLKRIISIQLINSILTICKQLNSCSRRMPIHWIAIWSVKEAQFKMHLQKLIRIPARRANTFLIKHYFVPHLSRAKLTGFHTNTRNMCVWFSLISLPVCHKITWRGKKSQNLQILSLFRLSMEININETIYWLDNLWMSTIPIIDKQEADNWSTNINNYYYHSRTRFTCCLFAICR